MAHLPDREAFRRLARQYRVVPVWRTLLADLTSPVAAFARLCGPDVAADGTPGRAGFLLESVDHGGQWGRWSFIGRDPRARIVSRDGGITLTGGLPGGLPAGDGVLATLEALLDHYRAPDAAAFGAAPDGSPVTLPPLHSGVVGYLGYAVVREVERLPDVPTDDRGWPDAILSVIGALAAYDHWHK